MLTAHWRGGYDVHLELCASLSLILHTVTALMLFDIPWGENSSSDKGSKWP